MSMKEVWSRIEETLELDNASAEKLTLKLVEELGEFSQALHWESGYKKTDKTASEVRENQLEEGADVIICMMAALARQGFEYGELKKMLNKKISKWNKKYERNKV